MSSNFIDRFSKILFVLSGGTMFMLLGATVLLYQDDLKKMLMKPDEAEIHEKVEALSAVKSESSTVNGNEFFSEEELKEMVKDTAAVKIEIKK